MDYSVRELQERLEDQNEIINPFSAGSESIRDKFSLEQFYVITQKYEFQVIETGDYSESVDCIFYFPKHEKIVVLKLTKSVDSYHLVSGECKNIEKRVNCVEKLNEDSLLCVVDGKYILEYDIRTASIVSKIEVYLHTSDPDVDTSRILVIIKKLSDDKILYVSNYQYQIINRIKKRTVKYIDVVKSLPTHLENNLSKGYSPLRRINQEPDYLEIDSSTLIHVSKTFRPWIFIKYFLVGEIILLFDYLENKFLRLFNLNDITIVYFLSSYLATVNNVKEEFLVSGGICDYLIIHNVRTGEVHRNIKGNSSLAVWSGDILNDQVLVAGSSTGLLYCVFLPDGDTLQLVKKNEKKKEKGEKASRTGNFDLALCRGKGTKELFIAYTNSLSVSVISIFGIEFSSFLDEEAERDRKERILFLYDEANKDDIETSILADKVTIRTPKGNVDVFHKFLIEQ